MRFHAHRQREGYLVSKFYRTHDASLLEPALVESNAAVEAWKKLAAIGDRQYYDKMQTGPVENGHWKDSTFLVETNPKIIEEARELLHTHGIFEQGFDFGRPAMSSRRPVFTSYKRVNDYDRVERFTGVDPGRLYEPRSGFGFLENADLKFQRGPMVLYENLTGAEPTPDSPMPLNLLHSDFVHSKSPIGFRMDLPMEPFRFTFVFSDQSAKPTAHGPFEVGVAERRSVRNQKGDIQVKPGETVTYQYDRNIRQSWFPNLIFWLNPSQPEADAMISALTIHRFSPSIGHAPVVRIDPSKPCTISATITLPPRKVGKKGALSAAPGDRLEFAKLQYKTDATNGFKSLPMATQDGFVFSATIPVEMLKGNWLEYRIEAADVEGHSEQFPKANSGDVLKARITADKNPPVIRHIPIEEWSVGKPLPIEAQVTDPDGSPLFEPISVP